MAAGRHDPIGSLLVAALGVAALAGRPSSALAQANPVRRDDETRPEVVVTATRLADQVLTAKVEKVLSDDPYLFVDHLSVTTENGIVRLEGIATDVHDLNRALMLARRVAGRRRVVNDVDLWVVSEDNDK